MMNAMKSFLLRLPEAMNEELDAIASDLYCTKSAFVRQSISRNLDVCRNVEMPLLRNHHQEATVRQLRVLTAVSNERKD